jgi:hypothetical protein
MFWVHQKFLIHICYLLLMNFKISSLTRPLVLINFPSIWLVLYQSIVKISSPRKTQFEDNMQNIKAPFIKIKIIYSGFFITYPFLILPMFLTGNAN